MLLLYVLIIIVGVTVLVREVADAAAAIKVVGVGVPGIIHTAGLARLLLHCIHIQIRWKQPLPT
jgi:hypothetical protein